MSPTSDDDAALDAALDGALGYAGLSEDPNARVPATVMPKNCVPLRFRTVLRPPNHDPTRPRFSRLRSDVRIDAGSTRAPVNSVAMAVIFLMSPLSRSL